MWLQEVQDSRPLSLWAHSAPVQAKEQGVPFFYTRTSRHSASALIARSSHPACVLGGVHVRMLG